MFTRIGVLKFFVWMSVLGWGIGLGAKLFDLLVVAAAWTASPPASFALLPYGPHYPMNPGDFFQPLSAIMAVGVVGALAAGWKADVRIRRWLWLGVIAFLAIWAITPTIFWPMIHQLYGTATGKIPTSDADSIQLAESWLRWDWFRVALIGTGFVASVRALTLRP
jgi:hypothetical protein